MTDLPTVESLTIPAGPFLPVLHVGAEVVDVDMMDAAMRLSDRIREHAPNALPLIVLGDAQLTMLDDDQLAQLGLIRVDRAVDLIADHRYVALCPQLEPSCIEAVLRQGTPTPKWSLDGDTPTTGVDEIPT